MTMRAVASAVLVAVVLGSAARAEQGAPHADPAAPVAPPAGSRRPTAAPELRRELDRVARSLDMAVRSVSRPTTGAMGGSGTCRGYHLPGYGAVFVLAPRALPVVRARVQPMRPGPQGSPFENAIRMYESALTTVRSPEIRAVLTKQIELLRAQAQRERQQAAATLSTPAPEALNPQRQEEERIRAAQEQARALQREAEQARHEAEADMQIVAEELQRRMGPEALAVEAPSAGVAPPAADAETATNAAAPEPPWLFWLDDEEDTGRTADAVIRDVSAAVTTALESQGTRLDALAMDEYVVVAVDFFGRVPTSAWANPHRTLVVRARKRELVERQAGRLTPQELRQRIEYEQY